MQDKISQETLHPLPAQAAETTLILNAQRAKDIDTTRKHDLSFKPAFRLTVACSVYLI